MAEINLGNENEINVNISTDTNIGATVPDINYIPGYQVAEEERRANEVIRQSNEQNRIALYEDMENKLATGYFDGVGLNYDWEGTSLGVKREDESEYSYTDLKGDTGNDGVSPSASVSRGTGSATITVTDASGTTTAVIYDGEKGEKGDKGDPGEVNIIVVEELPETGVEDTIYLVPLAEPDVQGNNYAEYIYINGAWELLGKVGIATDLTDYVKNTDYASLSKAGVVKTNSYSGFNVNNAGSALCDSVTYSQYEGRINDSFISKGTLENVITGKGLVASSSLSTVATSGSYNDLSNKPTIPDELADLTDDSTHRLVTDADKTNWNNKVDSTGNATTTGENTSFSISNVLEAPLLMDLKGNTQQTGTPTPSSPIPVNVVSGNNSVVVCGKNLFDGVFQQGTLDLGGNGGEASSTARLRTDYIVVQPNTTYTISNNNSNLTQCGIGLYKSDNSYDSSHKVNNGDWNYFPKSFTTQSDTKYIRIIFRKESETITPTGNYQIQLEQNSTATTYSSYTGTTYNIDLPVENLCNGINQNVWISGSYDLVGIGTGNYGLIIATNGGKYTISTTTTQARYRACCIDTLPTSQQSVTGYNGVLYDNTNHTFTIDTSGHNYLAINATDLTKIQIEEGTKANTYTPYGTTPIELNKIGNYQDYFYKQDDKWYLHKEVGKVVLDGSEAWELNGQNDTYGQFIYNVVGKATGTLNIYCNRFINEAGATGNYIYGRATTNRTSITIAKSLCGYSLTAFSNYLSNNNTYFYYLLETPTNTEITYTPLINQLNTLQEASSYEGTTNINQVNNDLPFIIDATVFNDNYNGRYRSLKYMYDKISTGGSE